MTIHEHFHSLPPLEKIIQRFGLHPNKSLGQHFLTDESLLHRIVTCAGSLDGKHVLEIGPGPGGLTRMILASNLISLCVVEQDARCIEALSLLSDLDNRITVIEGDALKTRVASLFDAPCYLISNLPYNIGTELLLSWFEQLPAIASMTLMFQKEVADRIMAVPSTKSYGRLSVLSQWLCDVEHHMDIDPDAFYPPPKVVSSVITLTPKPSPFPVDKKQLETLTKCGFQHRRKTLRSNLKKMIPNIDTVFESLHIAPMARAEELSVEQWCHLAQRVVDVS